MRAGSSLVGGVTAMAACCAHDAMSLIQQQRQSRKEKGEEKSWIIVKDERK